MYPHSCSSGDSLEWRPPRPLAQVRPHATRSKSNQTYMLGVKATNPAAASPPSFYTTVTEDAPSPSHPNPTHPHTPCAPLFTPARTTKQSQSYLFFWDKLEKCNYFLENVLLTKDKPLDGRLLQHLLKEPICDGGKHGSCLSITFILLGSKFERLSS